MAAKKQFSKRIARLLGKRSFKLSDLPEFSASLDTGYDKKETIAIVERMYKNKRVNLKTQQFSLILFEWIELGEEESCEDFLDGRLEFSSNWNVNDGVGKLNLRRWTTIRIKNDTKYIVNGLYEVEWDDKLGKRIAALEREVLDAKAKMEQVININKNLFSG